MCPAAAHQVGTAVQEQQDTRLIAIFRYDPVTFNTGDRSMANMSPLGRSGPPGQFFHLLANRRNVIVSGNLFEYLLRYEANDACT